MPKFFTGQISSGKAVVTGQDARHMALSLRMRAGEQVVLCDDKGRDHLCTICAISPQQVTCTVLEVQDSQGEPSVELVLLQALPKGDKLEHIVQKSVELGVSEIIPVLTERCISRPSEQAMRKKEDRLRKIAQAAAQQSGRGRVPTISPTLSFTAALERLCSLTHPLFFYENADLPLSAALPDKVCGSIGLLVGSEGGFSPREAQLAHDRGLSGVSLGSRILRCETAPIVALSAILFATGNL